MDDKKQLVPSIVIGLALVCLAGALFLQGKSQVTVSVAPAGSPVTVSGQGGTDTKDVRFGATPADQITNWTGGAFSGDLSVGGNLSVTGDVTVTGNLVQSTTTGNVVTKASAAMSSTATTTACSFQNTSGITRVVLDAGVVDRGTTSGTSTVTWQAGTSTGPGVAPTFTKVVNAGILRTSGIDVITTTSTVMTAYSTWASGDFFNFISSTTTNVGSCKVLYY